MGLDRELNPGPLAPEARIIPLDHRALINFNKISEQFAQSFAFATRLILGFIVTDSWETWLCHAQDSPLAAALK